MDEKETENFVTVGEKLLRDDSIFFKTHLPMLVQTCVLTHDVQKGIELVIGIRFFASPSFASLSTTRPLMSCPI
jgi:hypothetical protein